MKQATAQLSAKTHELDLPHEKLYSASNAKVKDQKLLKAATHNLDKNQIQIKAGPPRSTQVAGTAIV